MKRRILLVDGHSVIFAWADLAEIHQRNTAAARETLGWETRSLREGLADLL